ncbi:MAG: oligosaccharide flippase family protein [Bacteroidetes bacterium]|nr:oligosaccharide flippase family protein [Bacteroidota bacterium]
MLSSIRNRIQNFGGAGHERTSKIKKNIAYSFLIKGASVLISYLLVPLTLHYINNLQYGIWITISSLVAWTSTFDIGLGNGLRNKLAHSNALNDNENNVKYVSTTYAMLFIIGASIFLVFLIAGSFFNWNQLLNIPREITYSIWPVIVITMGTFCIQFVLQPVNSILTATHDPFKSSLILLFCQCLTLVTVFILTKTTQGSLMILVIAATGAPVLVFLIANIYLFGTSLKSLKPRFSAIDFSSAKSLLNVGGVFFVIQLGALILYETDNIVIAKTLGPADVTIFNIAFKYFSILTVVLAIVMTPYWSAFTDAYAKKDMDWIRNSMKKMRQLWLYATIAALVLCGISNIVYKLWVGTSISFWISLSLAINVSVQTWQIIHSYMLNGVGKLRVQLVLVVVTGILNIPLSVILIGQIGIPGTVVANIVLQLLMNAVFTYQCRLIMEEKATGVWAK